ncbi:MAG: DUF4350 domain-containing protein [Polaribacter sp.]|nr:DUF4350 domain-containing protein [Polaribacter sp.]
MDKKLKIYIALFIAIVGGLMYADATKPKPINWFPSFVATHKIPYGTYVLKAELPSLLPKTIVQEIHQSPFQFLADSTKSGTYFFVNGSLNFDKAEFKKLLAFVARGNTVFVATNGANIDTLGLETQQIITTEFDENFEIALLNPAFSETTFTFNRPSANLVFSKIDTLKSTALGKLKITNQEKEFVAEGVNFIKHQHGKGNFYFHTAPLLFTNYNLLKETNATYVANALSYIPADQPILWDAYYKNGKSKISSPMHYVLGSENLKWAYYIALIGVLFFVVFKSKRVQRLIPVVEPLKNQTLAFTRTVANMYYEKSEHKNIATHKITYFQEHIRTKLHLPTSVINESFYNHLAARSGNKKEDIISLFKTITTIGQLKNITKEQLINLNKKIESFMEKQSRS